MTNSAGSDASSDHGQTAEDRQRWTLIAVCGATFMLLVDVTIVQVALPSIQRHLHASFSDLQWVIDAYALALASLILTCGSAADRFGRKRIFVGGLIMFTMASLLCGLATTSTFLIWARALQGIGGAAMFATGLALIGQEFQGVARGKAIAAWGATVGGAVAVGPLVGGLLTNGLGWRWIFFVNLPIGVLTGWLSLTRMINIGDPGATRLDVAGLTTFSGSMFLLIFGLVRGNADGWTSTTILTLIAGSVCLIVLFIIVELRQEHAMFDLSLFRRPGFVGASFATFAMGAGMFAMFPYLTFYLQNDLGYSPLAGGLRILPCSLLCFIVPLALRSIVERLPIGAVLGTGLAVTAVGLIAMHGIDVRSSWTGLIPGLLLTGVGIGIANPAIARAALGVVPPQRSGMASGINNTCRIGGLAIGVAALGAVFQSKVTSSLSSQLGRPATQLGKVVTSAGVRAAGALAPHQRGVEAAARTAFVSAIQTILLIGGGLVIVGAVVAVLVVRACDMHRPSAPVAAVEI